MSDSRLYSRLLLTRGHGYPLFHPQPFDDLPLEARKNGTEIGDVGIVTSDGSFDPIFNICRPANENRFGVPEGFERVKLHPGDIAPKSLFYRPGSDVSSTKISKRRLDVEAAVEGNVFLPLGLGAVVEVSTSSKATAILLLPDGASRTNLRRLQVFRDYALKHAERWYTFVNGDLGRMLDSGELYLVTGVDKSSSWSVAALENNAEGCEVSLKLKPAYAASVGSGGNTGAGASCAWEWECTSSCVNSGPMRGVEEEAWTDNQTVFLRGFKVAVRSKPLKLKSSVKVLSILDAKPGDILSKGRFSTPFSRWRSDGRGGFLRSNTRSSSGEQDSSSELSKPYHPADSINAYLLEAFSDAQVSITHDDEWASVVNEDNGIPTDTELIARMCQRYTVENTCEGVFFRHIDSAVLKKAPSPLANLNPTAGPSSAAKLHPFPEIVRKDLRARAFNRETSADPTHEFEDPASDATPDAENLANIGDSVLRLIVAGLVSEMYPGLQVAPGAKLRDLLLDDATLDNLCEKSQYLNRVNDCLAPTCGIQKRDHFKAFIGAIHLEQGFESAKRLLDAPFRDYSTSAYNLLRESYGHASKQISAHIGAPSMPQPYPPPSPSSPDSSTNHLTLFNESLQKSNRQAKWVYMDHSSVGVNAGSNGNSPAPGSPPRGSQGNAQKWSVEVLIDGEVFGWGEGSTKKAARNEAAKQALSRLA